jgi:DNA repair exonuclease SbcCD nuclease subunit
MSLRIIHTADAHLGAKFLSLGPKGAEQRELLVSAFDAALDLAVSERADLVLLAGDLFDSIPAPGSLVDRVAARIEELTGGGIQVVISPGTHDPYGPTSPYALPPFRDIDGLFVFTREEMERYEPPGLDCAVFGNANTRPFANRHPLAGFKAESDRRWNVGILHASFEIPDVSADSYVVTPAEIAASGLDYLALGHIHSMSCRSSGKVTAYYSGSPEMVRIQKGEFGLALLVELDETATVRPVRVSTRGFEELTIRAEGADASSLDRLLRSHAGADKILKLSVEGVRPPAFPDIDAIVKEHAPAYFFITVSDRSWPAPSAIDPASYPRDGAAAAFLEALAPVLTSSPDAEKDEVREAMRLGVSLLDRGAADED